MHNVGHGPNGIVFQGTFADGSAAYRITLHGELTLNQQRYPLANAVSLARKLNLERGKKGHKPCWTTNRVGRSVRVGY